MTKARNIADLGSNDVIETTATGVDVTGTVTADGLTLQTSEDIFSWASGNGIIQAPSNVYMRSNGAGNVILQSNGKQVATFNNGGDVSFYEDTGTTAKMVWYSSEEQLQITSANSGAGGWTENVYLKASQYPSLRFWETTGGKVASIGNNGDGSLVLSVNGSTGSVGTNALVVNPSGNVGIGTASPWETLSIPFNEKLSFGSSTYPFSIGRSSAGELVTTIEDGYDASNTRIDFKMRAGSANENTALSITGAGNVGIGTASPSETLTVVDSDSIYKGSIKFGETDSYFASIVQDAIVDGGVIYNSHAAVGTTHGHKFHINGTERARIDSSGTFMVNTTAPSFNPQVAIHTSKSYGLEIKANTGSTAPIFVRNANGVSGSRTQMFFMYDSTTIGSIGSTSTSTSYNTTSDERLKENIQDTTHSVNIDDIQVREFDWKSTGEHQRFGFIAQELETVYPEAVSTDDSEEQMKSVDYSKLVPLLVKEIQTLKARIETLENN